MERRGGGGGRNPSPSPPPWLLPRKRDTWGVSSPSLPSSRLASPPRRSAPRSRSRRCGTRPPRGREGPAGSRAASGTRRTGPFGELRGRGGMRGAAAPGGGARGRLRFASGRESGGGSGAGAGAGPGSAGAVSSRH